MTEQFEEVFSGIRSKIKTINGGKELFYEKNCARIGVNTDDDVPLNKPLKFLMLTIIIRCIFSRERKIMSAYAFRWMVIWVSINATIWQHRYFRSNWH